MIYWAVDTLNRHGYEAYVLHSIPGFRYTWFDNQTEVAWYPSEPRGRQLRKRIRNIIYTVYAFFTNPSKKVTPNSDDILVIPETRLSTLRLIFPRVRKIILNQNPFFALRQNFQIAKIPGSDFFPEEVKAMITFSDLNFEIAKSAFSSLPIYNARLFVDSSIFEYSSKKKLQIAYMPRRGLDDLRSIINLLGFRGSLNGVELVSIESMDQHQVAQVFKESLIFLTFSSREGFGLPAAEAMACGCVVVGSHGGGGREFFDPEYCYPVDDGDYLAAVHSVEECLADFKERPSDVLKMGLAASNHILSKYSQDSAEQVLVELWESMINATL